MKASIVSLAALAASAFAAPAAIDAKAVSYKSHAVESRQADAVNDAIKKVEEIVDEAGVTEIVEKISKRDGLTSSTQVVKIVKSLKTEVLSQTKSIHQTLYKVKSGAMTKKEGRKVVTSDLKAMHFKLTDIVTDLTGAAGLKVIPDDVDTVLDLVTVLLTEVLTTVKAIVTILGLTPQLTSLLHSVFSILAELLTALTGLLAGLLPGLVAALSPLLAGLGNGLLAPILTPLVALLAGLSLP